MKRIVVENIETFKKATSNFDWSMFSIDTETNNELRYSNINLTDKTWKNGISLCDGETSLYIHNGGGEIQPILNELRELFKSRRYMKESLIFMHNAPFEAKVLFKHNIRFDNAEWFDTLVAYHLIDENSPKDLKTLSAKYLGADVVRYESAVGNETKFIDYAINDAIYTYSLAFKLKKLLEGQNLLTLFKRIEMPFLRVITEMETNGFTIDTKRLEELKQELKESLNSITLKMCEYLKVKPVMQVTLEGGMDIQSPIDFNSPTQLREVLFEKLGIESVGKTETGKNKTGKEFLMKMKDKHEFVNLLSKYRKISKLSNAFFNTLPEFIDDDNRIRSFFRDTGTRTGRLSSNNPNLQQLPKADDNSELPSVRSIFITTPGYTMITADYSGQELRVLAQITGDEGLINAFNSGRDFHQETADMFDVTRSIAKQINFGIAYRKNAYSFSKDWDTTEEEAQKFLDNYFSKFPKIKELMNKTDKFLDDHGYVITLSGRRRHFKKEDWGYPRKAYREAFNFLIQGFSADMMRVAGIKILNLKRRNKDWDLRILACVHDEFVIEVKDEYVETAMQHIKQAMESSVNLEVPIIADVKTGRNYHEAK